MFFKAADGMFDGIDAMLVRCDQLNRHLVLFDVFLNSLGSFVIHDIKHRMVLPRLQNVEDFSEGGDEGCAGAVWHWVDDDGVKVINVCTNNVLHILEGSNRKRPSDICVHGAGRGAGKGSKAKHVVHRTCFVDGECWKKGERAQSLAPNVHPNLTGLDAACLLLDQYPWAMDPP